MISSETIHDYLSRLASRQPTPGGGAAAALHAAQGAALVAMVARYTTGAKYEEHAALVTRITSAADHLIVEALRLADADEHAFQSVIDSYKLPSESDELKAIKTAAIQEALVQAAHTPPAQLIKVAGEVVDLATELFEVANPNVISDIAAAADAARAAATTARVNIDINVVAIKHGEARSRLAEQTNGIEDKVVLAADAWCSAYAKGSSHDHQTAFRQAARCLIQQRAHEETASWMTRAFARSWLLLLQRTTKRRTGTSGPSSVQPDVPVLVAGSSILVTMPPSKCWPASWPTSAPSHPSTASSSRLPLPAAVRADRLVGLIAPEKDIDGANPLSLGRLAVGGQPAFAPATAQAVVELLDHFQIPVAGRNVAVVGRSAVVGKPLSLLLLERDATVTICHSKSGPLERYTQPADVVVVAAGRTGLLKGSHLSPETVVIDVGTNVLPDGSLVGDVDEASVTGVAAGLSPVPGGVGSVTTALLLLHTVEAARQQSRTTLLTASTSRI